MTATQPDQLIEQYLARLNAGAATVGIDRDRREELANEVRDHIRVALRDAGAPDVAAVRDVLDRLGSPEAIAAATAESPAPPPSIHQGPIKAESVAILLLSLGPIAGLFEIGLRQGGWLLAFLTAATLVVRSAMWSRREKLVGLLMVPAATLACCTALAWRVTASGISGLDVFLLGVSGALGGIYLRQRVDARIAAVFSRRSDR